MKKLIFFVMTGAFLFLAACNHSAAPAVTTAPSTEQPTESAPPAKVGDLLDVPEIAVSLEEIAAYETFRVEILDSYFDRFAYAWEYSFATDTAKIYSYDEYEGEEIVNVVKRDNAIRYFRVIGDKEFVFDYEATDDDWVSDKDSINYIFQTLTQFSEPIEGITYKKLEDVKAVAGDACAYEVRENGVLTGYVYIDKATGILSAWLDKNGTPLTEITNISTEEANIPKYK